MIKKHNQVKKTIIKNKAVVYAACSSVQACTDHSLCMIHDCFQRSIWHISMSMSQRISREDMIATVAHPKVVPGDARSIVVA